MELWNAHVAYETFLKVLKMGSAQYHTLLNDRSLSTWHMCVQTQPASLSVRSAVWLLMNKRVILYESVVL
jgi:hypothetical protein